MWLAKQTVLHISYSTIQWLNGSWCIFQSRHSEHCFAILNHNQMTRTTSQSNTNLYIWLLQNYLRTYTSINGGYVCGSPDRIWKYLAVGPLLNFDRFHYLANETMVINRMAYLWNKHAIEHLIIVKTDRTFTFTGSNIMQ